MPIDSSKIQWDDPKTVDPKGIEWDGPNRELAQSAVISHNINPDQYAENVKKAKSQGMPRSLATPAEGPVNTENMDVLINKFLGLEGVTARHVSNPRVAAVAHDDTDNMTALEKVVRHTKESVMGVVEAGESFATGVVGSIAAAIVGLRTLPEGVDAAKREQERVSKFFTYQPTTEFGKHLTQQMSPYLSAPGEIAKEIVDLPLESWKANPVTRYIAETISEFAAYPATGIAIKGVNGYIGKVVETAKKSKLRERDPEAFREFTKDASEGHPPVQMPAQKAEEMLTKANKSPEEFFDDSTPYWEAKFKGETVDIPIDDIAVNAKDVKPENIKEMGMEDIPSVNEAAEIKPEGKEGKAAKVEKAPDNLRPAVNTPEGIKEGKSGQTHNDIVPDTTEETRGFVTPEGEFIGRAEASQWMKENDPQAYESLSDKAKTELHSEDLKGKAEEGEYKESKLAERTEADAIEKKLTDEFGELAEYKTMNMKEQASQAQKIMDADYEQAKRIAMGEEPAPKGVREASVYEAVKIRALQEGDVDLLQSLATDSTVPTKLSEYGQAIKAADSRLMEDPVKAMQDVAKDRAETVKKTTGKKPKVQKEELAKLSEEAKKTQQEFDEHVEKMGPAAPDKYGSKNTIINEETYLKAKEELRKRFGSTELHAGVDPSALAELTKIGVYHLEAGTRAFKAWSDKVIEDVGDWVKPHLKKIWSESQRVVGITAERSLKSAKTRMKNETANLEEKLENLDFSKKDKPKTILDEEGKKLKAARDQAKQNYEAAAKSSGVVTKEEATEIVRLSKQVADSRKAMEEGGNRLEYGAAKVNYENYVTSLKEEGRPLKEQATNRLNEFKTTWKDNPAKAVWDISKDVITTITDNSVAMVATLDNSFIGRQGLHTLFTDASRYVEAKVTGKEYKAAWWPAAKQSFIDFAKTVGGYENAHNALMADIYSRENFINGLYQKAKIISKTEEQFPSTLPEHLPGVVGRVFKGSEYAFTGSALRMRTDLMDLMSKWAKDGGIDVNDPTWARATGKMINSLTARGQWGERGDIGIVRLILWAPKMLKGNIDVMTAHALGAGLEHSFARKQAAYNIVGIVAQTAAIMAIANSLLPGSAEYDPRSTDFGKIKVGDTRFDISGGAGSIVTLASRIATGETKSASTGIVSEYGTKYGQRTPFDALVDFLVNKTTPPAHFVVDWLRGKDYRGQPFSWGNEFYQAATPISIQNVIQLTDNHSADAVAGVIFDALGINANTYQDDAETKREITNKFRQGRALNDEQQTAYDKLTEKQKDQIDKEAGMTPMQAAFSHLTVDAAVYAWKNASDKERADLDELYQEKIDNYKATHDLSDKESDVLEERLRQADERITKKIEKDESPGKIEKMMNKIKRFTIRKD